MSQHLTIQFPLCYLSSGGLREVTVKWWITGGSKYSNLTWKLWVFWKTSHWGEMIAYEKWSQPEVPLYCVVIISITNVYIITVTISWLDAYEKPGFWSAVHLNKASNLRSRYDHVIPVSGYFVITGVWCSIWRPFGPPELRYQPLTIVCSRTFY